MSRVILGSGSAEITERKSRFIAQVFEIHSGAGAEEIIYSLRKKHRDARHNCYAYVLGRNDELQRFSDDKEPAGTAGKPILDVITGSGLHNTLVVVTRYFGGILLGTGGLVRAYSSASLAAVRALENGECEGKILEAADGILITFSCDYKNVGKIKYLLSANNLYIFSEEYDDKVKFSAAAESTSCSNFIKAATDATSGAINFTSTSDITFCHDGDRAILYDY